jgi:hypothetical protein
MPKPIARDTGLDGRLTLIRDSLSKHEDAASKTLPGLQSVLHDWLAVDIRMDRQDFMRRLLKVFKDSTDNTYQDLLGQHSDDEKHRLERFVEGASPEDAGKGFQMPPNLATRQEVNDLLSAPLLKEFAGLPTADSGICLPLTTLLSRFFSVFKKEEKRPPLRVHKDATFRNWGRTVEYKPEFTCVPTTVRAVQQIVRYAKKENMGVRVAAYRHSWAPVFGRKGDITISMLHLKTATKIPNTAALPLPDDPPTELETIEFTKDAPLEGGKRLVRVGCATTNERLRRWCLDRNLVTLPFNVIMVETTVGGSTSALCHGSGRMHSTMGDLVRRVEYVDANGELRTIDGTNEDYLKAAGGCFGLIGIVTHITLLFDPMSYAIFKPVKLPVIETIPPPPDMPEEKIPPALRPKEPLTAEKKAQIQKDFEDRANNDYYAEWFWCPYSEECWINTWDNTTDPSGAVGYPSDAEIFLAFVETFGLNVMQDSKVMNDLVEWTDMTEAEVTIISFFTMLNFPEIKPGENPIKVNLPDALHYQRAIQNVRVRELEVEIPLTAKLGRPNGVDYTNVQRAWWDAILQAYEHNDTCPQRMPLEMRIMGGSDMLFASQRGNDLGTCCIGVLTLENAAKIWEPYAQGVLDKWTSYTDAEGKKLRVTPHWAKEW